MPPADRVFALLEQEFAVDDVRAAVARAVKPDPGAGLGPHRSLIDLSKAPDGTKRLVTTNFDLLFEKADPDLTSIVPPLPPPRSGPLIGVIHLHGKVNHDYSGAAAGEFVLSSADFGRAYLADSWATAFMRALMERYRIVFVGYSADDPPMQYLLEALSRSAAPGRLYAFHEGEAEQAAALWRHKGVTAMPFTGFDSLWASLDSWAVRARDPARWRASIVVTAQRGPRLLDAYERGQIAHLVSSHAGAKNFSEATPPPPPEWLCVFDPALRYDGEHHRGFGSDNNERWRPFETYCLDDDAPPDDADGLHRAARTIPTGAWSALEAASDDRFAKPQQSLSSLRGALASNPAELPARLSHLANWISRVAGDPLTVWWAAGQGGLHPVLRDWIKQTVDNGMSPEVRNAWRLLFSSSPPNQIENFEAYSLQRLIQTEGWSHWALRELVRIERPRIRVARPYGRPPVTLTEGRRELVDADVVYPAHLPELIVSDELLPDYVRATRYGLEAALPLEIEARQDFYFNLHPIMPFEDPDANLASTGDDLPARVIHMARLMTRLVAASAETARREIRAWPDAEHPIFRLLHVWAAGVAELTTSEEAGDLIKSLSKDVFWDGKVQRDLLIAIKARWPELHAAARGAIEAKILEGPDGWDGVDDTALARHRAWCILNRLFWLRRESLAVSFELSTETTALRAIVPEWTEKDALNELERSLMRAGYVAINTEHESLLSIPLDQLLDASDASSGSNLDYLVENRPFRGLAQTKPVRALAALVMAATRGETRESAWRDFLSSEARKKDTPRLRLLIAERIVRLPSNVLRPNLQAATEWLRQSGRALHQECLTIYLRAWERMAMMVVGRPANADSAGVSQTEREWLTAAINAPAGRLAWLLSDEFSWAVDGHERMTDAWSKRAEVLLSATGDALTDVAAVFATKLNWLFYVNPEWTESHIMPLLEGDQQTDLARAATSSLLRYRQRLSPSLFIRLKPLMLKLIVTPPLEKRQSRSVMEILLYRWRTKDENGLRLVSNQEMREALIGAGDDSRVSVANNLVCLAEADGTWNEVVTFFSDVWPRQLAAKTPSTSAALAGVALSSGDHIAAITQAVLPLLTRVGDGWMNYLRIRKQNDNHVERFPEEYLSIFYAVLPEDARGWAYDIDQFLERLSAIEDVRSDPRLVELRRRAAAR